MLNVSSKYKREMAKPTRGQSRIRIVFSMVDVEAKDDVTISGNGSAPISDPSGIAIGVQEHSYATAEREGFRLDGRQRAVPDNLNNLYYQGYVSSVTSGMDGRFVKIPEVDMGFGSLHVMRNLTLTFDPVMGRHPSKIAVVAYRHGTELFRETYDVDGCEYVAEGEFDKVSRIIIRFLETPVPEQRARLSHVEFGSDITFENEEVTNAKVTEDVDPITRRLSVNDFSFTILNFDKLYNVDNPRGIWRYFETKQPIKVSFGLDVQYGWDDFKEKGITWNRLKENGITWREMMNTHDTEWLDFRHYVLSSTPTVDGNYVTFTCTDLLGTLTATFFDSEKDPKNRSMYGLAVKVLSDAGLTEEQYKVHSSLRNLYTNAILPEASHRDCLKTIAQASLCILYTDKDGVIRLEPNSAKEQEFHVGFDELYDTPKIEKSPQLMAVEGKWYQYGYDAEKGEFTKSENTEVWQFAEEGAVEQINNPLITSRERLLAVVDWYEAYLHMRNTYYLNYRGSPELECNDRIQIDTEFYDYVRSITLKHEIDFNGGIRGSLIVKRLELRIPTEEALPFVLGGTEFD